jgi:hypothetical protein
MQYRTRAYPAPIEETPFQLIDHKNSLPEIVQVGSIPAGTFRELIRDIEREEETDGFITLGFPGSEAESAGNKGADIPFCMRQEPGRVRGDADGGRFLREKDLRVEPCKGPDILRGKERDAETARIHTGTPGPLVAFRTRHDIHLVLHAT